MQTLRLAALAAVTFFGALAPPSPACACSCAAVPMSAITLAVRGEVTAVETRDLGQGNQVAIATIDVQRVVRGRAGLETVRIAYPVQNGINCGVGFRVGQEQLFLAYGQEGAYRTSLCIGDGYNEAQLRAADLRR